MGSTSRNPEKFYLGDLSRFRGKTIDEVIKACVEEYLEGSSFNRVEDITHLLKDLDLDFAPISVHSQSLLELMNRRHAIVHRADRAGPVGDSGGPIQEIDSTTVFKWARAVDEVTHEILMQALSKQFAKQNPPEPGSAPLEHR